MRHAQKIIVGKLPGKRPLRKPWRRCEDNIKTELSYLMKWIQQPQNRV
jgi:hypothetical protein